MGGADSNGGFEEDAGVRVKWLAAAAAMVLVVSAGPCGFGELEAIMNIRLLI